MNDYIPLDPLKQYKRKIAKNLAKLRKSAKLTQQEFADALNARLGTTYKGSAISAWEHASNSINSDYMPVIANILDVSLEELYGQNQKVEPGVEALCETITYQLNEEEREDVSEYIRFLLHRREMRREESKDAASDENEEKDADFDSEEPLE